MSEFGVSALLTFEVDEGSLRRTRRTMERKLGEVTVEASPSGALASAGQARPMGAGTLVPDGSGRDGGIGELINLAEERNEFLEEIAEGGRPGGRGGGGFGAGLTGGLAARGLGAAGLAAGGLATAGGIATLGLMVGLFGHGNENGTTPAPGSGPGDNPAMPGGKSLWEILFDGGTPRGQTPTISGPPHRPLSGLDPGKRDAGVLAGSEGRRQFNVRVHANANVEGVGQREVQSIAQREAEKAAQAVAENLRQELTGGSGARTLPSGGSGGQLRR